MLLYETYTTHKVKQMRQEKKCSFMDVMKRLLCFMLLVPAGIDAKPGLTVEARDTNLKGVKKIHFPGCERSLIFRRDTEFHVPPFKKTDYLCPIFPNRIVELCSGRQHTTYNPDDFANEYQPESKDEITMSLGDGSLVTFEVTLPAGNVPNYESGCGRRLTLQEDITLHIQSRKPSEVMTLFITGTGEIIHRATGQSLMQLEAHQFAIEPAPRIEL
jgi:hypothetical protein